VHGWRFATHTDGPSCMNPDDASGRQRRDARPAWGATAIEVDQLDIPAVEAPSQLLEVCGLVGHPGSELSRRRLALSKKRPFARKRRRNQFTDRIARTLWRVAVGVSPKNLR
jgi:hypothetical protein